ncbi:MAG: beta-galactosidase trimerization domain-containing protein, partial [Aristaeellaceae bacterium]
ENLIAWQNKDYTLTELCERVHPTTARVLAAYEEDFYAGEPALLVNACGQGKAYYMAARAGADFLLDFYRMTAPQAGAAPCIRAELPSGVTANCREKGETDYLFLQNWNDHPVAVSLHESLTNFESGVDAGSTVSLDRYEVRILRRRKHG